MPPFVIEASVLLAILGTSVKITNSINRIEQAQKQGYTELVGHVNVLRTKIEFLERESLELKNEIKESRRHRYSDPNS